VPMPLELAEARDQIVFARDYTLRLLDGVPEAEWFAMPGGVSHVGWQVGHLAMAEYRTCLERVRGIRPEDEAVIPAAFLARFVRDTVPDLDPSNNPSPAELRATLDRVHARVLEELPGFAGIDLSAPLVTPHVLMKTKIDILRWCGRHELIHAGQIGLLRRQLGHKPLW
jgi:hypothetical protein